MLNREIIAVPELPRADIVESNFDWSRAEPIDEFDPPSFEALDAYFFEVGYDRLTEGHDTTESLREPLTVAAMNAVLGSWFPAGHTSRFVAGTLVCPIDDDPLHPLRISSPDKMFFAFSAAVDSKVSDDLSDSPFPWKSLGVAAIRTRSNAAVSPTYRFLMEIPVDYSVADMKDVCYAAGLEARSNILSPMHLAGCETAWEWIDVLMAHRQPGEYIESTVEWFWRMPRLARKARHRSGWARNRARAAIKRAA